MAASINKDQVFGAFVVTVLLLAINFQSLLDSFSIIALCIFGAAPLIYAQPSPRRRWVMQPALIATSSIALIASYSDGTFGLSTIPVFLSFVACIASVGQLRAQLPRSLYSELWLHSLIGAAIFLVWSLFCDGFVADFTVAFAVSCLSDFVASKIARFGAPLIALSFGATTIGFVLRDQWQDKSPILAIVSLFVVLCPHDRVCSTGDATTSLAKRASRLVPNDGSVLLPLEIPAFGFFDFAKQNRIHRPCASVVTLLY
ncbi:MAG: hypothetical protein R3A47_01185 [Polyangiales bacterium]